MRQVYVKNSHSADNDGYTEKRKRKPHKSIIKT